ncbi:hypothetical protein ACUXNN_002209 [Staphylococcus hominis]
MIVFNIAVSVIGIVALIVTISQSIKLLMIKNKKTSKYIKSSSQDSYNDIKKKLIASTIVLIIFVIINTFIILM